MRKSIRWLVLPVVLALVLVLLPVGTMAAFAQESEDGSDDGVVTMEEAPRVTPPDLVEQERSDELPAPDAPGSVGSFEALVWDDTANPDGALNEGEIYVDGLTVNLYIKNPKGDWILYGTKKTGAEPKDFFRNLPPLMPWINPLHEHGWVGWDRLPTNFTGIERLPAGDTDGFNEYAYTDYKMVLVPEGSWLSSNGTERYGRLYAVQWWPFQWACALWYYPQSGDPETCGFGVWEPSSISGYVFEDRNADGAKSKYEPYQGGWTVILTVDLVEVARCKTDSCGRYKFEGLAPGLYQVWEAQRFGWKQIFYYHPPIVPRPSGVDRGNHFVFVHPHEDYGNLNFGNLNMCSFCAWYYYNKYCLRLVAYWLGLGVTNPNSYL